MSSMYRIKDTATGLYSYGGDPFNLKWGKIGKVWTTMGALKNHLHQMPNIPPTWEIVEVALADGHSVPMPEIVLRHQYMWSLALLRMGREILKGIPANKFDREMLEKKARYLETFYPDWRDRMPEWEIDEELWNEEHRLVFEELNALKV